MINSCLLEILYFWPDLFIIKIHKCDFVIYKLLSIYSTAHIYKLDVEHIVTTTNISILLVFTVVKVILYIEPASSYHKTRSYVFSMSNCRPHLHCTQSDLLHVYKTYI